MPEWPATAAAEKPGRSVVLISAVASPSASTAGSQPEPSTRATSWRSTPVSSASRSAACGGELVRGLLSVTARDSSAGATVSVGAVQDRVMIDHLGINCSDLERAAAFYDAVLGVLGHRRLLDYEVAIGYGTTKPDFWIGRAARRRPGVRPQPRDPRRLLAPTPPTRPRVLRRPPWRMGAEVLHEPRHFPEYHDHYFGAFVRDPDGNNVEAVCHTAAP